MASMQLTIGGGGPNSQHPRSPIYTIKYSPSLPFSSSSTNGDGSNGISPSGNNRKKRKTRQELINRINFLKEKIKSLSVEIQTLTGSNTELNEQVKWLKRHIEWLKGKGKKMIHVNDLKKQFAWLKGQFKETMQVDDLRNHIEWLQQKIIQVGGLELSLRFSTHSKEREEYISKERENRLRKIRELGRAMAKKIRNLESAPATHRGGLSLITGWERSVVLVLIIASFILGNCWHRFSPSLASLTNLDFMRLRKV